MKKQIEEMRKHLIERIKELEHNENVLKRELKKLEKRIDDLEGNADATALLEAIAKIA